METQDVDVVEEPKVTPCTIWGSDKVLTDIDEIENYRSLLKEVVIDNLLIGTISDDGNYILNKDLKRDLMRMQKGVADESPRYYLAYATVLDKTFHFSIAIDDLNENEVIATLYLTESVQDYPYLESVRTFVASVMLPNDDLKARIYKTFNLVDTIPDNNDDKLIQNLLLRMLEIVNQAAPSSAVEEPHNTPQVGQKEIKGDKKPAAKPKAKSAAKPAKKAENKKKDNKKADKKKDDKKKEKKLEDLLGKKYDPFKPAFKSKIEAVETIEIKKVTDVVVEKPEKPQKPKVEIVEEKVESLDDILMDRTQFKSEKTDNEMIGQNPAADSSEQESNIALEEEVPTKIAIQEIVVQETLDAEQQ